MSHHVLRAAALAAAWLPAAWAAAAPLTLDQAMDLAVERSQMTRSARAAAAGAAEMAHAAGQQPDPMLSVGIDNLPADGARRFDPGAEDMTMKRIGISQEWVSADKRAAREAVANAMQRREEAMERVAVADARLQTATAYIDAYFASRALELASINEMHAREELEVATRRLSTVSGSSAEVLGLNSALGMAEDESAELRQQHGAASVGLQRWTGIPVEELEAPSLRGANDLDEFVANHPSVLTKQRDIDVARRQADATRLRQQSNWTYEVSYGQRQGRPDMVSFGVSIPLTVAPAARQDRETAASLALIDKAQAELVESQREAAGEFAALANDVRRLQERLERLRVGVLRPLAQRHAATLAAYRSNQASLDVLFQARHAEADAQRRLINLQRDLARAQAQLALKPVSQGVAR